MPTPTDTPMPIHTASPANTPSATPSPPPSNTPPLPADGCICISEYLAAPRDIDWDGDGTADYHDEWIEVENDSEQTIFLGGWQLDDTEGYGSTPYVIPAGISLLPGECIAFYQAATGIALNNDGDVVRLLAPDGSVIDEAEYGSVSYDCSRGRVGGCTGDWTLYHTPSPGASNPMPLATATPSNTHTPIPTHTPSPTPTVAPIFKAWVPLLYP